MHGEGGIAFAKFWGGDVNGQAVVVRLIAESLTTLTRISVQVCTLARLASQGGSHRPVAFCHVPNLAYFNRLMEFVFLRMFWTVRCAFYDSPFI